MTENDIKRLNNCKEFQLSELGDVITGRKYKPRQKKVVDNSQQSLFEV